MSRGVTVASIRPLREPPNALNAEPGLREIVTGMPVIAPCRRGSRYIANRALGRCREHHRLTDDTSLLHHFHSNGQILSTATLTWRAEAPPN